MQKIIIFEDGKSSRGQIAKLIKRGNKRVLIEFVDYDYEKEEDVLIVAWFNLFIPSYTTDKKSRKHNNKRKQASYCHGPSNMFYCDYYQTVEYKDDMKKYLSEEYYNELFN